jgi:hypothetical protein
MPRAPVMPTLRTIDEVADVDDLIDAAALSPFSTRLALTQRVILWCVEAYFGHLGRDVAGRGSLALSDAPASDCVCERTPI